MSRHDPFLQGFGYVVSIASVALLAIVAWLSSDSHPMLRDVIIVGAALSVFGMLLRWYVWWRRHGRRKKHHK